MFPLIQGCNLIAPGAERYAFPDETTLLIKGVHLDDRGTYTCSLNYTLAGVRRSMSESINAHVIGENRETAGSKHGTVSLKIKHTSLYNLTKRLRKRKLYASFIQSFCLSSVLHGSWNQRAFQWNNQGTNRWVSIYIFKNTVRRNVSSFIMLLSPTQAPLTKYFTVFRLQF